MHADHTARAWVELSAPALRRNYRRVVEVMGDDPWVVPMVKADGYGLGALGVIDRLRPEGVAGWGVATVTEGVTLRRAGVREPVAVFTPVLARDFGRVCAHDLDVSVSDPALLAPLAATARGAGRTVGVHLEIDTGMGRAGLDPAALDEAEPALRLLRGGEGLKWTGLFTHLHSADEPGGPGVRAQLDGLLAAHARLAPPSTVRLHAANSAGAFRLGPEARGARPGIFLYGGGIGVDQPAPEPVATVRARVLRVAAVRPGTTVGYGATYRAAGPERWATLAIGYGDGLPRQLGNCGHALVGGQRVPIIGRISMDVTVVNISAVPGVEPGNLATLVGRDGAAEVSLDEVATRAGTISYEILTGLSPRLPRIWTQDDDHRRPAAAPSEDEENG